MLDLIELRNREFLERYRRLRDLAATRRQPISQSGIIHETIMSGAPRYYTTFDYAYRMICLLRRGNLPLGYNDIRHAQWREISYKVDKMKSSLHINSDFKALALVLSRSTASRFFISQSYAGKLIQRLTKENPVRLRPRRSFSY